MCCASPQCRCSRRKPFAEAWWIAPPPFDTCGNSPAFSWYNAASPWNSVVAYCRCDLQQSAGAEAAQKPFVNYRDELLPNISRVSVGETSGLFPTDSGEASKLYRPSQWDKALTQQLLECRAAVTLLATRGERHHAVAPKTSTTLERTMAAYHLKDNFPPVAPEIQSNANVRYFYLSPDSTATHKGLDYSTWDIKLVKSYGPFYNVGGGDVPRGKTYLNFYSGTRKTTKK